MFSFVSLNARGKPLESLEVIINLIAGTTTSTGLRIYAQLDDRTYETGVEVTDAQLAAEHHPPHLPRRRQTTPSPQQKLSREPLGAGGWEPGVACGEGGECVRDGLAVLAGGAEVGAQREELLGAGDGAPAA